jgi:hypothetical protein
MRMSTKDFAGFGSLTRCTVRWEARELRHAATIRRGDAPQTGARAASGYHIRMTVLAPWRTRLALAALLLGAACSSARAPVRLEGDIVIVENQTSQEWRNVVITVNDHFRGGSATLAPGGRLTAPLSGFQTAFGQRFSRATQSVAKIEVAATDAGGAPVALTWAGDKDK